jgi:hypothetical protein
VWVVDSLGSDGPSTEEADAFVEHCSRSVFKYALDVGDDGGESLVGERG